MASLLPLLHDLLPMFMPSEVQVARSSELVSVEERAERPPWYQQTQGENEALRRPTGTPVGVDDVDLNPSSESDCGEFQPIQLFDHEEHRVAAALVPDEQGRAAMQSDGARNAPVTSPPDGPKVFRQNVMVGVTDKMCVSGKQMLM